MPEDYRLDPFTNTKQPILLTNEKWTIPSVSPFTIRLFEVPLKETPSSLSMRVVDSLVVAITTAAQNIVTVQNGAWFPVNAVITIDSEKMQVVGPYSSAATTLSAAITSTTATTFTAASGAALAVGEMVLIDSEYMLITAISTNTVTVTRGYNGSAAATHASGAGIYVQNALTVTRGYNGTIATTHTSGMDVFIENSMAEVSAVPTAGQFWPDYSTKADGDSDWNTGTILFNNADVGKQVAVNYKGMGNLADSRAVAHGKQLFTVSGTFTVPAGVKTVYVSLCGGGGNGGNGGASAGGGGGGAGDAKISYRVSGLTIGASVAVTVGGIAGTSSFGSFVSCAGGGNGGNNGGNGGSAGGPGGSAGGRTAGQGGSGLFGNGGLGGGTNNSGAVGGPASGYGAGGGGGAENSTYAGGAGTPGMVLVEW